MRRIVAIVGFWLLASSAYASDAIQVTPSSEFRSESDVKIYEGPIGGPVVVAQGEPIASDTHGASPTIDMTRPLVDDDGIAIKDLAKHRSEDWGDVIKEGQNAGNRIDLDPQCNHCPPLTLGTVIYRSLVFIDERKEGNIAPEDKEAWHDLGKRLLHDKAASLTTDEIVLIKQRIDKAGYSGMISEQVKAAIDPTYAPPKIKPAK